MSEHKTESYSIAGLDHIYYLTRDNQKLSIYLEDFEGEVKSANYSTFYIEDSSSNYLLSVSGYSGGDSGDSFMGEHF
ncbi:hypothetical protein EB796_001867 [Bugula neritina]|uniref:Fibrinogen C-terminal domain-containing protein n=1 Tax=Bugula neritina TaxID=10212 RepID=A0A7J7KNT4_BUGNE|nr:hypothetical protein EB796_001867 [Bugula neritina]